MYSSNDNKLHTHANTTQVNALLGEVCKLTTVKSTHLQVHELSKSLVLDDPTLTPLSLQDITTCTYVLHLHIQHSPVHMYMYMYMALPTIFFIRSLKLEGVVRRSQHLDTDVYQCVLTTSVTFSTQNIISTTHTIMHLVCTVAQISFITPGSPA